MRNRSLDFLKGISILIVIFTHYAWESTTRLEWFFPFWVDMAVPMFMIISGYVSAKSFENKNIHSIGQAYNLKLTVNKLIRYTVPYMMAFIIEETILIIRAASKQEPVYAYNIFMTFLQGGIGQGSFYFPILFQFVFVFPVIYILIDKSDWKGLILCGLINALYELLQCAYGMNVNCYRLLVFRYILLIAAGCYLAIGKTKIPFYVFIISFVIGFLFKYCTSYGNYQPIIIKYWVSTSFVAVLYFIPIAWFLIKRAHFKFKPVELLGRASYNIFFTQMIYYYCFAPSIYQSIPNKTLQMIISILICTNVGILFYYLETPISNWIKNKAISGIDRHNTKQLHKLSLGHADN